MSGKNKTRSKKTRAGATFSTIRTHEMATEYVLNSNGLHVLYVRTPASPTITTNIVYHVGSKDELPGETGLAHMLEHMLFKETKTKNVSWKRLESNGALLNATTWLDRTMYFFTLPKRYLGEVLKVEADRMRNVPLVDKEFLPERANVQSEYEMYNSEAGAALEWQVVATAFQSHGYRHDTIGHRLDIDAFTVEKLTAFYNRYYWPNNATLIVVGDIEEPELFDQISQAFNGIPAHYNEAARPQVTEPPQAGERKVTLERATELRIYERAFKAPSFLSRDWVALYLFTQYVTNGTASPLYKTLVRGHLATAVSAHLYPTRDPFLLTMQVNLQKNVSYEKIDTAVMDTIDQSLHAPLRTSQFSELTHYAYAQELFSRDGTMRIAATIAECVAAGDWMRYYTLLSDIQSLTPKELQQTVRAYVTRSQSTYGIINTI